MSDRPRLIHAGAYTLYETPGGGRHLVYQRIMVNEDGRVREIDDPADEHLPDIPAEALPFISYLLEHGLPPQLLAILAGKASPLRMLTQLRALANGDNGDSDAG